MGNIAEVRSLILRCTGYWLISRLLILAIWTAAAALQPSANFTATNEVTIDLMSPGTPERLAHLLSQNDSGWYLGIASDGYERRPFDTSHQANWAFFPLAPVVWHWLGADSHSPYAAVAASNLFFGLGLCVLLLLMRDCGFSDEACERSIAVICFFPTSYFFSLPLSESLFFFLSVAAFAAAVRKQWTLMAFAAMGACATRLTGVFLVAAMAMFMLQRRRDLPLRAWLALAVAPLGLLAFMWHLHEVCGDAFAFIDIQAAWGRWLRPPFKALGIIFVKPWVWATDWNLRPLNTAVAFAGLAASVYLWKRNLRSFAVFLALCIVSPLLTGSITSISRYTMSAFPFAMAAGGALEKSSWFTSLLALGAVLLGAMCVAYAQGCTFASA